MPGLDFYYVAFEDLTTCRGVGMALGPIPWTAMRAYCDEYGLTGDDRDDLYALITAMDIAYLKHCAKKEST